MLAVLIAAALQDAAAHPWAKFRPGTWAKYESRNVTETWTLKEVTAEHAVITVKSEFGDTDRKLPLKASGGAVKDKGTESLDVAGKTFKCEVKESVSAGITFTTWHCKDAPGGVVKATQTGGSSESGTRLVAVGEKVQVGDKEVTCWVTETTVTAPKGKSVSKSWMSADVPGGLVKTESSAEFGATRTTTTRTLVAFEIK